MRAEHISLGTRGRVSYRHPSAFLAGKEVEVVRVHTGHDRSYLEVKVILGNYQIHEDDFEAFS